MTKTFLDKYDISGIETSCFIYRRTPQGPWQYCIGIPSSVAKGKNNEIKRSCKTKDFEKAKRVAYDAYKQVWKDIEDKKSVHKKTFKQVATEMMNWRDDNESASTNRDYQQKLDLYLIPFFWDVNITSIKQKDINEFWEWRVEERRKQIKEHKEKHEKRCERDRLIFERKEERRKKNEGDKYIPKMFKGPIYKPLFDGKSSFPASTILSEKAPLKAVFDFACGGSNPLMSADEVPNVGMPDKGGVRARIKVDREKNPRVPFMKSEIERIQEYFNERFERKKEAYIDALKHSNSKKCKAIREQLRSSSGYSKPIELQWFRDSKVVSAFRAKFIINTLIATGMRPETLAQLRVKDVLTMKDVNEVFSVHEKRMKPGIASQRQLFKNLLEGGEPEREKYVFLGKTKKGGIEMQEYIVPDAFLSPIIEGYLAFIGVDDPNKKLVNITGSSINQNFHRVITEQDTPFEDGFLINGQGKARSVYSIRHYYITQKIIDGISESAIAKNCQTSTKVIEGYYNKISSLDRFYELSGWDE